MKRWIAFWNILAKDMRAYYLKPPLSNILPVTYGVDILQGAVNAEHLVSFTLDFIIIGAFCIGLFVLSLRNIKKKWIS